MEVEIRESVRDAGLEQVVRNVSDLFPKVIARALQHRVRATWDVLTDRAGKKWVLVALTFDGEITERDVFDPSDLDDPEFMRDRLGLLWDKVLRTSLKRRVDAPPGRVEVVEPVIHTTNG